MAYTPDEFAALLVRAIAKAPKETRQVVSKGALNVKDEGRLNARVSGGRHAPSAYKHITYDVTAEGVRVEAEIGYEKTGQGNLGVFLEYGSVQQRTSPKRDLGRALDHEDQRFVDAIGDMAERLLD